MKSLAFCLFVSAFTFQVRAQMWGSHGEFRAIGSSNGRYAGFYKTKIIGNQFFNQDWSTGILNTESHESLSDGYLFLYDKVRQSLFIKQKDSAVIYVVDKNQIASFALNTDMVHNFVAASKFDPSQKGNFFEIISIDADGYSLFKLTKTTFIRSDEPDFEDLRNGVVGNIFRDQITYYIMSKSGSIKRINLNEHSIEKAMPLAKDKTTGYFIQYADNTVNEIFLEGLIQFVNS